MDEDFIYLFNLFKNDIYRLAYSYTCNVSDADDVTQSVFIKLYKRMNKFDSDISIKKWLIKVTINECKTLFLSSWYKRIVPISDREENISVVSKDNDILSSIMELPKKYKLVIYLYYYENYKIKEITDILKMNENTVKTNLSRARDMLKDILKEEI